MATILIVFRILWLTRDQNGVRAVSSYRSVIEIVVESALLYSLTLIAYIVLLFYSDTSDNDGYAQAILIQMTVWVRVSCPFCHDSPMYLGNCADADCRARIVRTGPPKYFVAEDHEDSQLQICVDHRHCAQQAD
jgi:hypothetical protein